MKIARLLVLISMIVSLASSAESAELRKLYAKTVEISLSSAASADVGDAALTNFPVLVRLSPGISGFSYSDFKETDGHDLAFGSDDGTELPYEIDTWNPQGESLVWVKVPELVADTKITCYYGGARNEGNSPTGVWSGYHAVWHLNPGAVGLDSAGNGFDLTVVEGSSADYAGPFGSTGVALTNALKVLASKANTVDSTFTVSGWYRCTAACAKTARVVSKLDAWNSAKGYGLQYNQGHTSIVLLCNGVKKSVSHANSESNWNHISYAAKWGASRLDANGGSATATEGVWISYDNSPLLLLGADQIGEEFRLRRGMAEALYTKMEYQTMADADFLAYQRARNTAQGLVIYCR